MDQFTEGVASRVSFQPADARLPGSRPGKGQEGAVILLIVTQGPSPGPGTETLMGQTWGLLRTGLMCGGGWGAGKTQLPYSITC